MMLDHHNVAAGKARAQLELCSALRSSREGPGQRYAINFFRFDARDPERKAESFVGKRAGRPILAGNLGLLDCGSNSAILNYAAGGVAEESAQPDDDTRHA
jgi:hypothetical protein